MTLKKTEEQLIRELSELKSQLNEKKRVCRELSRELAVLKPIPERPPSRGQKAPGEEWLSNAFENHPDALVVSRVGDGRIERVNPAFLDLFGYSRQEVLGKSSLDLGIIAKDDREEIGGELGKQGSVRGTIVDMRSKSGAVLTASVSVTRIGSGDESRIFTNIHDITEHKRTEKALRESEARYRMLFDTMDEAFVVKEMIEGADGEVDFVFLETNPAFERQSGLKDVVGKTMRQAMPGISSKWIERYAMIARTGESLRFQDYVADPGRWFDVLAWRIEGAGSRRVAMLFTDITERKQTEEALAESEKRFRLALRNSPVSLSAQDTELRYIWAYNQHTISPEEIVGRLDHEIFTPREASRLTALKRRVLEEKVELNEQMWFKRSSGRIFLDIYMEPIVDKSDRVTGVATATVDQTPVKIAEEWTRKMRDTLRAVIDAAPAGIAVADKNGRILLESAATESIFGCPFTGDAAGKDTGYSFSMPDGSPVPSRDLPLSLALTGRTVDEREIKVLREDGTEVVILCGAKPLENGEGEIWGAVTVCQDITRLKKTEKALRDAEEQVRRSLAEIETIYDTAPVGLCVFDTNLRWIRLNKMVAEFSGLLVEEHIGKTPREILPETGDATEAALKHILATGEPLPDFMICCETASKPGEKRCLNERWVPLKDDTGRIIGISVAIEDITERRRAKEALRRLNETLERRVAKRTALARARAKEIQTLAVELIEAEEKERRRIALLLHDDLQQLLASARMQLQAACETMPPNDLLESVQQVLAESIDKSRHLSHELYPSVLRQAPLVEAIQWLIRKMESQFDLHVELRADEVDFKENALVKAFVFRAAQEMLFNVVKHSGVKEARVDLHESGNRLVARVGDHGRGFDPAILDRGKKSPGLGLISLRERASHLGGAFSIESAPGQGCRFTLTLPVGAPTSFNNTGAKE